jgi:hypothetical protein
VHSWQFLIFSFFFCGTSSFLARVFSPFSLKFICGFRQKPACPTAGGDKFCLVFYLPFCPCFYLYISNNSTMLVKLITHTHSQTVFSVRFEGKGDRSRLTLAILFLTFIDFQYFSGSKLLHQLV